MLGTRASGVQIYDCKASKDDPYRFEWVFRAPEADRSTRPVRVSANTMQADLELNDGSTVVGGGAHHAVLVRMRPKGIPGM